MISNNLCNAIFINPVKYPIIHKIVNIIIIIMRINISLTANWTPHYFKASIWYNYQHFVFLRKLFAFQIINCDFFTKFITNFTKSFIYNKTLYTKNLSFILHDLIKINLCYMIKKFFKLIIIQ